MPRKSTLYLPPEVVEIIAGYLAFEHPPTLLNFVKASRTYYASSQRAIKSIKFHDIMLQISSHERFQIVVNRLIEQLKAKDGLPYVRRLIIFQQFCRDKPYEWNPPQMSELRCNGPGHTYTTQYGEWTERFGREKYLYGSHIYPEYRLKPKRDHCHHEPIVKLIKLLPGLTDLIWNRRGRVPPSVIEALSQVQSRCRLHLDELFHICDLDPEKYTDDLAFVTSPSIHSFKINCDRQNYSVPEVNPRPTCYDSVLRFAKLAPNLQKIRINRYPRLDGPTLGSNSFESGTISLKTLTFETPRSFDGRRLCESSFIWISPLCRPLSFMAD